MDQIFNYQNQQLKSISMQKLILLLLFFISVTKEGLQARVKYPYLNVNRQTIHLQKVQAHNNLQNQQKRVISDWMKYLNDYLKVSQLSIPGTHDTGTFRCTPQMPCQVYQCQSWSIYEQLSKGIRYLDLRVNSQLPLSIGHKNVYFMQFEEVLIDTNRFLKQNPSQFLIFAFQRNVGDTDPSQDILQALNDHKISIVFQEHVNMPKVGDLRGKVWIYSGLGINFKEPTFIMNGVMGITQTEAIYLQNYWQVFPQNITKKTKFATQTAFEIDCIQKRMKINFLSGSVGINPFQLAKNEQGPNSKMLQALQVIPEKCLGVTIIDFPQSRLIKAIIKSNSILAFQQL